MSRVRNVPGIAVLAGLVILGIALLCAVLGKQVGLDSAVYQAAGRAVLGGDPLYARPLPGLADGAPNLPFIYPPFAALVFVPLAPLSGQLAWAALGIASVLALGVLLRAFVGTRDVRIPVLGGRRIALLPLVFAATLLLEPGWRTVGLGQVNILLMCAVAADVLLLRGSRSTGVLTGIAAAIKLTPLIFVLHLAVTGRRADAARALATFAVLTAAATLLFPADSARFWRTTLSGGLMHQAWAWAGNQSITGVLQRLSGSASWVPVVAAIVGGGVLILCVALARTLHSRADDCAAVLVTGCCQTLISPISWTHHWVWVLPLLALLAARASGRRARGRWALPAFGVIALVFSGWAIAAVPSGGTSEQHWNPLQALLGNSYVLAGLLAILLLAVRLTAARRAVHGTTTVHGTTS